MRLIDADELIEKLKNKNPIGEIGKITLAECIEEVKYTKTITPEQKKYGKWIINKYTSNAKCSECKYSFTDAYDLDNYDLYCRHCGSIKNGIIVV